MWTFLMKMFQKNTTIKICDQCGVVLKKNDPAICLHGIEDGLEYEVFVCEPCCIKIAHEYDEIEDLKIAEDRDDYTE